jgi:hypothetical protein
MSGAKFPPIHPGGSLILAWQVKDKHVLMIGGGEVNTTIKLKESSLRMLGSGWSSRQLSQRRCADNSNMSNFWFEP